MAPERQYVSQQQPDFWRCPECKAIYVNCGRFWSHVVKVHPKYTQQNGMRECS